MTRFKARCGASAIAICTMLAGGLAAAPVLAQTQPSAQAARPKLRFNIPAGPLAPALSRFAEITGIQLVYPSDLVSGLSSPGLSGDFTSTEALQRLVRGTGLSPRMLSATSATLEPPAVAGARTLGVVRVEGVQTDTFTALNGFGAGAGSNGSSDPTATEGTHSLTTNGTSMTAGTPLSMKQTPQSISVMTNTQLQQQNLTDLNAALNYMPGITVFGADAISRGMQIMTYQIDGGGALPYLNPFTAAGAQNIDLSEYDSVSVLRGSDALMAAQNSPGGVISLTRKRPLDHNQLTLNLYTASWNNEYAEVDATGPVALNGHLRARVDAEYQNRDFFYDSTHDEKFHLYGTIEADLDANTLLRVGGSYGHDYLGAPPLGLPRYLDGADLNLPRSTCNCATWAYTHNKTNEAFANLEHRFSEGWDAKLDATRTELEGASLGPGTIPNGVPSGTPPTQAKEAWGGASSSGFDMINYAVKGTLSGQFSFRGRPQVFSAGMEYSNSATSYLISSYSGSQTSYLLDPFSASAAFGSSAPGGAIGFHEQMADSSDEAAAFLNVLLEPIDHLHLSAGFRVTNDSATSKQLALSYAGFNELPNGPTSSSYRKYGIITPSYSLTYDITPTISAYGSYARTYQDNSSYTAQNDKILPPTISSTWETGVKGSLNNGALNISASLYYSQHNNLVDGLPIYSPLPGCCYITLPYLLSEGLDLEAAGQILPGWQIHASYNFTFNGYKQLQRELAQYATNTNGQYLSQQPEHQIKIWTSYTLPGQLKAWTVSSGFRMESARFVSGSACLGATNPTYGYCLIPDVPYHFTQPLYGVLDLSAEYKFNTHWRAALNLTNIVDERYYYPVGSTTGANYYGEPRAVMVSVNAIY